MCRPLARILDENIENNTEFEAEFVGIVASYCGSKDMRSMLQFRPLVHHLQAAARAPGQRPHD
jgi:hypothetical protein